MNVLRSGNWIATVALLALTVWPSSARSGDLYVSGQFAISGGVAESGGSVDLGAGGIFPNSGSDTDSSPVFGGAVGYQFPLSELVPADWDWPLPDYAFRVELEGLGGRDYELVTRGPDPYLTRVEAWSLSNNFWMDFPVHDAVAHFFGRVPLVEPLSFSAGAGVGLGGSELSTTNNVFRGSELAYHFQWQVGGGVGYRITDRVSATLGYRYVDSGEFSYALANPPAPDPVGTFKLDLSSHEVAFGLRVSFHSVPSPGAWSVRRGR